MGVSQHIHLREVCNNNWKSHSALCSWPKSWITPCGSALVSPHCFCFLMSQGIINKLHQKAPFLFLAAPSVLWPASPMETLGWCAGVMSSRLASLLISDGKLWLGSYGTSGKGGISLLLVFQIRFSSEMIVKNDYVIGEVGRVVILRRISPFLFFFSMNTSIERKQRKEETC